MNLRSTLVSPTLSLTRIQGFDEFMNLVIDDAVEVRQATNTEEEKRRPLGMMLSVDLSKCPVGLVLANTQLTGQILLKGDNVSLIQAV